MEDTDDTEEMSGAELLEKWQDQNKVYHFEMNTKNLSKIVNVIGYGDDMFGTAVENFLNDNPGAQLAIVEWIAGQLERGDWRDTFLAEVEPSLVNNDEED
jgi:hypothetical protein